MNNTVTSLSTFDKKPNN